MLMRTDPFRELDRLAQQFFGPTQPGTWTRPAPMPMDAYRTDSELVIAFDLPGINPDAVDIDVERNVLTVKAERRPPEFGKDVQLQVSERPLGVFSRQLFLGESLDTENIQASYDNGVLLVRVPVVEQAKARKVAVTKGEDRKAIHA